MDLSTIKNSGYEFVILRSSCGVSTRDKAFEAQYEQASDAGIPVGVFVDSYATTPDRARQEAQFAVQVLAGRKCPLGIYIDIEKSEQISLGDSALRAVVSSFADVVRSAGYIPGAYGSELVLWGAINEDLLPGDIIRWVAKYSSVEPRLSCDLWQRTDKAVVYGYNRGVDEDVVMSDRMKKIIEGTYKKDEEKESKTYPVNPSIATMQFVMQANGYWGDVDGRYSDEFIDAYFEFGRGMEQVWTGKQTH